MIEWMAVVGCSSAGVQRLTKKLAAVQEELKQRYKDSAESVQEKFALMKRVQELEKIVADLENSYVGFVCCVACCMCLFFAVRIH